MGNSLVHEKIAKDKLPENTVKTLVPQAEVPRELNPRPRATAMRSPNILFAAVMPAYFAVNVLKVCPQGVHVLKPGYKYFSAPHLNVCVGPSCQGTIIIVLIFVRKGAANGRKPHDEVAGDFRWTSYMILATWKMAETG